MIAAVDNSFLILLLNPDSPSRLNPATKAPVPYCKERIEDLIDDLSQKNGTLLIPAPALAESLCASEAAEIHFERLQGYKAIEVAPFGARAALELGRIIRAASLKGDKRFGQVGDWQHVKMDRTIIAIAKVHSVEVFYSDDTDQIAFAKTVGLLVRSSWDLPLSERRSQRNLDERSRLPWPNQKATPTVQKGR